MRWLDWGILGVGISAVGIFVTFWLGWGAWREHQRRRKRDHLTVWKELAQTIIRNYKELSVALYPYAEVKGAIRLSCVVNDVVRARDLVAELARVRRVGEHPRPSLVIGEYGQGKTIACGALAHELATSFLKNPNTGRLPILVSLRDHFDLKSVDQVALASVRRLHNFDLDPQSYSRARSSGRLVFIFDGLDELLSRAGASTVRDYLDDLRNDAAFRDNRLIITSRPNVFDLVDVAYLREGFDRITIQLPTLKQVYDYLNQRGLLAFVGMIQRADAELLRGLIRRPLFLDMITASKDSLPNIHSAQDITESKIYDQYFAEWYNRELPKMGPTIRRLTTDQVDRILSSAAYQMSVKNSAFIDESEFVAIVQQEAHSDPRHELDMFEKQATNRLLLVPEFSAKGRRFTFRHDSLRSYFSAHYLYRSFVRDPEEFLSIAGFDSVSLLFFLARIKGDQTAHSRLSTLYQSGIQSRSYRRDLLGALILHWAIDGKNVNMDYLHDFCANAPAPMRSVLLTNLANKDLSGLDLSGLDLSNAVLRNSRLVGTVLKNVDLRNGVLDGAKLSRGIIEETSLTGASFNLSDLTEASLTNVVESGADFEGASLKKSEIVGCNFSGSRFTLADITGARLVNCAFDNSQLISTMFDNSVLEACRWRACDVNGASFRGASLSSCEFSDTNIGDAVGLPPSGWTDGRLQ